MDRIQSMRAFHAVAHEGSFSLAAQRLQLSPQLVSKYVSQLEDHLNIRLLNRTTRRNSLTEAGKAYLDGCEQVLSDIDELESSLSNKDREPHGKLRISAPVSFGTRHLAGFLKMLNERYPDVAVDLELNDRKINLVEEGFDIALRIGKLEDSSLVAKKLSDVRMVYAAAPQYLEKYGTPKSLADLQAHKHLAYSYAHEEIKRLFPNKSSSTSALSMPAQANNGDVLCQLAERGVGIISQPTFICGDSIRAGTLQIILRDFSPPSLALYAVYPHRKYLSAKTRSFIDCATAFYAGEPSWDQAL